ncbi:MAG: hypothetical protein DRG83_16940, partial [Deltaproteobacteria bacterium]
FLPKYVDGVPAARILMFGLFFYAISGMAGNMLLTINKQVLRLEILLASSLLNLVFSYAALRLGYGIAGVAIGISVAYFGFFLASCTAVITYAKATNREISSTLVKVLGPIFYIGAVIALLTFFMPYPTSGELGQMVRQTVINEVALVVSSFWLIYCVWRGEMISSILRGA